MGKCKLTKLLQLGLVGIALGDGLLLGLASLDSVLNSKEPTVALRGSLSLEGVLVSVELEVEFSGSILGDVGSIGLCDWLVNSSR